MGRNVFWAAFLIFAVSQSLLLIRLDSPVGLHFDEHHYVPAAREFLESGKNLRPEHPPIGIYLISSSISLGGDHAFGWRWMSTFFGAMTLVGVFFWAFTLFKSLPTALFVTGLSFCNQLLFVQSRIAMLDSFMTAFIVWALVFFTKFFIGESPRKSIVFSGIFFGLAVASKWFAALPLAACILLLLLYRLMKYWDIDFSVPKGRSFLGDSLWHEAETPNLNWWPYLTALPIAVYFLMFLPLLTLNQPGFSLSSILTYQFEMLSLQNQVSTETHPYTSSWLSWPLMVRPMWYSYQQSGADSMRGILLVGNPLVMWAGLLALFFCAKSWVQDQSRSAFLILAFYAALYFSWAFVPRAMSFFYYYYPASLVLSLALGFVFHRFEKKERKSPKLKWGFLTATAALFVYFLPILTASEIGKNEYLKWTWFISWI